MRQDNLPKANASCKICGTRYYVCVPCIRNRDQGMYGWRLVACCPQCYQIFYALNSYRQGEITREQALEMLAVIEGYGSFPKLLPPYDEIYADLKGLKQEVVAEEPAIEELAPVKEVEATQEPVKEEKPRYGYYNKHKHNKR